MAGGIFNGNDANNTAEDGKTIVERCAAAGAPLDFWSVNNYAWASFGSELRSADFGVAKYQALTGLPIMISETGHSSTEDSLGDGAAERQPKAIPSTIWESLMSGAMGVHLFHWNDRSQFTQGYFLRERGFGIVNQDRTPKNPVYGNVLGMLRRMADIRIENLLGGSSNPAPDVQFFWSTNAEMVWPRANQEHAMIWGALKRAGYQPGIIDDAQFERGAYSNAPALLLSRCTQMNPRHLDTILDGVLASGVHVHANADLPGQFNAYYARNPDWIARMSSIFGLAVSGATPGFESSPTNNRPDYRLCRNGSILISLLNEHTNRATVMISAPALLSGRVVENLTSGGILTSDASGKVGLTLAGDDYVLLYAYPSRDGRDESLINSSPAKLWFESAPTAILPGVGFGVSMGYDIPLATGLKLFMNLERVGLRNRVFATAEGNALLKGKGTHELRLRIPDADLNDPLYVSSRAGAEYAFHAWLEHAGARISEAWLPVRVSLGVRPVAPPTTALVPRQNYQIALEWDELPAYLPGDTTPFGRTALWDSLRSTEQHYNLVLELLSGNQVVAANTFLTRSGTGRHVFSGVVPAGAAGPYTWAARVETAPNVVTSDLLDSFEGRDRGEDLPPFKPWFSYTYAQSNSPRILSQGIVKQGNDDQANQTAFLVVTNAANAGAFSGFGLIRGLTNAWALPADRKLWTNYLFAFAFKEESRLPCVLEMQVKDINGHWVEFTKPYQPGANGWDSIRASLADFVSSPAGGGFDPNAFVDLALNVRMQRTNATYQALFDNVLFTGPPRLADDFEDRTPGADYSRIVPWTGYGYDHAGHLDVKLNQGVGLPEAIDGSQSAFVVAWNRKDAGDFAGFGMFRPFAREWSLPGGEVVTSYSSENDLLRITGIARAASGNLTVSWLGPAVLQVANDVTGPWTDVPSATNPQVVQPSASPRFYRLRK